MAYQTPLGFDTSLIFTSSQNISKNDYHRRNFSGSCATGNRENKYNYCIALIALVIVHSVSNLKYSIQGLPITYSTSPNSCKKVAQKPLTTFLWSVFTHISLINVENFYFTRI